MFATEYSESGKTMTVDSGEGGNCIHIPYEDVAPKTRKLRPLPFRKSTKPVDSLDLKMVKMKMCLIVENEGEGWTQARADAVEELYRQFLKLHLLEPGKVIVPTKDIDAMWHYHILDTRKYHEDCQNIFGYYLHHFPYLGLRGGSDGQLLKDLFQDSCVLFKKHFGKMPTTETSGCTANCQSKCG